MQQFWEVLRVSLDASYSAGVWDLGIFTCGVYGQGFSQYEARVHQITSSDPFSPDARLLYDEGGEVKRVVAG